MEAEMKFQEKLPTEYGMAAGAAVKLISIEIIIF